MKILLVHNYYQQAGGEDACFADEGRLLEAHGHEVVRYTLHNDSIKTDGALRTAGRALWSRDAYRSLTSLIARERPAVMHCTNTFPLISPAAYYAARRQGVAVVQALHNYRLICPGSLLMRDGKVCEDCLGKSFPAPAVLHGCYRDSRAGSAVIAGMLAMHRLRKTWRRAVDRYYALTDFARGRFIAGGLPAEKIMVKPNFVFAAEAAGGDASDGAFVFVGRLSVEKGIQVLLDAWRRAPAGRRLKIIGDGPLARDVQRAASECSQIEWLGAEPNASAIEQMRQARALIVPSICYENFPRSIVEAFSVGTPVIASRLGAMAELVDEGRTGMLFSPGDAAELAAAVERACRSERRYAAMRLAAREEYLDNYTPECNYRLLMAIYRQAISAMNASLGRRDAGGVDDCELPVIEPAPPSHDGAIC